MPKKPNLAGYVQKKDDTAEKAKKHIEFHTLITRLEEMQDLTNRNIERFKKDPSKWNYDVIRGSANAVCNTCYEMGDKLYT